MRRLKAQLFAGMNQAVLKCQNAFADSQPRAQFVAIERLAQVVIGASVESADNILAVVLAGDQQNVLIARASLGANAAAQFRSSDIRMPAAHSRSPFRPASSSLLA